MARRLTKGNYRQAMALHLEEMARLRRSGSPESSQIPSLVCIGNMHWEFGDLDGARGYFESAVSLSREAGGGPTPAVAYWLWKGGHIREMAQECRAVIERFEGEVRALEVAANSEGERRTLMLAYWKLAEASFLLRDYAAAEEWSQRAGEYVFGEATDQQALRQLARSLNAKDREGFERALRLLRGVFPKWPDFMPGTSDLYRMALYLGRESFGSLPEDLAAEDPEPNKWDVLLQRR